MSKAQLRLPLSCRLFLPKEDRRTGRHPERVCLADLSVQSSTPCRQRPRSQRSLGNAVDVVVVLVGAVGRKLRTDFLGHIGPDLTDSCGERNVDSRRRQRLLKNLPGVLLGRDTLRLRLGGKSCLPLVRKFNGQRHRESLALSYQRQG